MAYIRKPRFRMINLIEFAMDYVNTDKSVGEIAIEYDLNYKNVWKRMRKAVSLEIISEDVYVNAYHRKNSLAKTGEKNPNYDSKLVDEDYKKNMKKAMTGKSIPYSVRQKISNTKKNGNQKI